MLTLHEVHEASTIVQQAAAENANIIFGAVLDESMEDAVKVTVIATGIKSERMGVKPAASLSPALRTAQQSVKTAVSRREKAPAEPPEEKPAPEVAEDDLDIPAFMRRPLRPEGK